jgi:hypothetical protein
VASKTSSRYRPPSATRSAPVSERGKATERARERARVREERFGRGKLRRRVFDVFVVDAPAWNATWAALFIVAPIAWMLGAWLLPALDIRPKSNLTFMPWLDKESLQPEPLEQQRYLLSLLAVVAIVPLSVLIARRAPFQRALRFAPPLGLLAVIAVAGVSLVRGYDQLDRYYSMGPVLAVVAAAVLVYVGFACRPRRARWLALAADRISRRPSAEAIVIAFVLLVAFGVTAVGIYNDANVILGPGQTAGHMQFTFEEITAVHYGRTPLVDYTPQYTALLSWLLAPLFLLRAPDVAFFTEIMAGLGIIALLCLYLTYRLVTGSAARALLLYLPTVAIGFVIVDWEDGWQVHTIAGYFALMPIRDLGPCVLGLLTIWLVSSDVSPGRAIGLGAASVVAILCNVDFGLPAAVAAAAAVLLLNQDERPRLRRSGALVGQMAIGAIAVALAFGLLTYIRSGSWPEPGQLIYFQRQFAAAGFFMLPMDHLLSLHTLVFATVAATTVAGLGLVAFGRVRPGVHGRRSAALLIYSGIFGFGAFEYYMGRTHPDVLSATFLSWGVAMMALCWEAGCRLAAGGVSARAIRPAAVVLLVASTVLSVDAIRHLEYAIHQPSRLTKPSTEFKIYTMPNEVAAARRCIPAGSNVVIMSIMPDRLANAARLHNWYAYDEPAAVVTYQQFNHAFDVADRHHVTAALTEGVDRDTMARGGFVPVRDFSFELDSPELNYSTSSVTIWSRGPNSGVNCHGAGRAPDFVTR